MDPLIMLSAWKELTSARPQLIVAAKESGATWDEIARATGMSRAQVINLSHRVGVQKLDSEV